MIHRQLTALSAVAFVLVGNTNVLAVPVNSWNLSRDLMSIPGYPTAPTYTNSPTVGAWTFLYGSVTLPSSLSTFTYWTVRSSRKINEFTRVSAPNVLHPSSRLTIAERLSMQGF